MIKSKGSELIVRVAITTSVLLTILMAIVSGFKLKSLSIADTTPLKWMLLLILISVVVAFITTAYKHIDREKHLVSIKFNTWKIYKWKLFPKTNKVLNFKYRQALLTTAFLFAGVAACGMSNVWYIQIAHYIFTLFATIMGFILVIYSSEGKERKYFKYYLYLSAVVWAMGVVGLFFKIYLGEFMVMLGIAYWFELALERGKIKD